MIYVAAFIGLILFLFGKEFGKLAGIQTLIAALTLVGCLFIGSGFIFVAILGRFL